MFAELEVRRWQQSVTEEHEVKQKERRKKCTSSLDLCVRSPSNPPVPSFITFHKIGD